MSANVFPDEQQVTCPIEQSCGVQAAGYGKYVLLIGQTVRQAEDQSGIDGVSGLGIGDVAGGRKYTDGPDGLDGSFSADAAAGGRVKISFGLDRSTV